MNISPFLFIDSVESVAHAILGNGTCIFNQLIAAKSYKIDSRTRINFSIKPAN